jgi:hypothetical protein
MASAARASLGAGANTTTRMPRCHVKRSATARQQRHLGATAIISTKLFGASSLAVGRRAASVVLAAASRTDGGSARGGAGGGGGGASAEEQGGISSVQLKPKSKPKAKAKTKTKKAVADTGSLGGGGEQPATPAATVSPPKRRRGRPKGTRKVTGAPTPGDAMGVASLLWWGCTS